MYVRDPLFIYVDETEITSFLILIIVFIDLLMNFRTVSSTYINKGSLTYMFTGTKILGGATFPPCYFIRGMSKASEKYLGSRPVHRRNTILKPFC